ncbi:hypothetical protein NIES2135_14910 [Leptolyngbya boryana NIES-2135]|jgi:hypothetical protein|uniref:Uncharacterized protein n=1 Tax=Leptolyngbya boryana NIES-2135 TaxID=1973484 RepID=A0A1Z4JDC8_LEPBY|nr:MULTISPECIES: hypothetical protein [Leptolyngbya]BAY54673.1 hypothetical protein NIES2135_14910 [Leptolyngbya boryana NIES-2135]MBD2365664.1 hypothetical protein [Leptolyngbya sp. FACHB-161]MBD2371844.1 hypothetical protein [Leptolyngbya sp. FACHB-238]MBD2396269.1 hypothetical protein [Leptolyngbya sp. FACHB-239]MBD2402791.1 hypothetical protein [Leptolyngbya sp. FACHB-402]
MKNIQIIDRAINCAYDIYSATDEEFLKIFPNPGQDIQFNEDIEDDEEVRQILARLWKRRVKKSEVHGIHGTLFYQLSEKKRFYPNKKDHDLTINHSRPQD